MKTLFPLTPTDRLREATAFYEQLFGMEVIADVGWYVQLHQPDDPSMQIAFIDHAHASIPSAFHARPAGVIITVEVADADALYRRAVELDLSIHQPVRDEEWGQRHFITEDPTGLLVDVVQPIEPSLEFLRRHGLAPDPAN